MASGICFSTVALCTVLTVLAASANAASSTYDESKYCSCSEDSINRRGFPDGFVEGAYDENGKGSSMWDHFTHTYPDKILDGSNGDVAVDSYHQYKEDVKLLKNMGADAYRFSISWPRILPGGTISKGVNQDGINYYNNLINELLANGIQPWVTILHLDTSQALQDAYGGFLSPQIVKDFQDFADLLFSQFGDRVKHWATINEPWGLSYLGYTIGVFAPGRCSSWLDGSCTGGDSATEPYEITHNQLLSHAAVVKLYRDKYQELQKGEIGIVVNAFWFLPYDDTAESVKARDRGLAFMLGWIMDPVVYGRYPDIMRERVGNRLPRFSEDEAEMVKGSFDFIGLNYYSGKYAVSTDNVYHSPNEVSYLTDSGYNAVGDKDGIPIGERGSNYTWFNAYPKGLRRLLQYIKLQYTDPLIYITENGTDEDRNDNVTISEALKDYTRKKFFFDHLCCLREAIELDGVNVKGFFTWSLTDNYEWASGYLVRYGLNYVDFTDKYLQRYPKLSAQWLGTIFGRGDEKHRVREVSDH
ncbi:hypothetical protein SASPL_124231 [Salvia splendens]|uniref:Beta-glucosidase n=1 Tax=Salvia splendens TaxID=180675 RepID=A0A8X8XRT6_SALSN|nr:hypothetical protein SASPL_124231 [Salvia splendens]